jgi:ribokinase
MDFVVRVPRLPSPGETGMGQDFRTFPGGKGANQAVAAARLGADVRLICKLGDDLFGRQAAEGFRMDGIRTEYCMKDPEAPSGVAVILVDGRGENQIVVASGANLRLRPSDLDRAGEAFRQAGVVLIQLEIPLETAIHAIRLGQLHGKRVILNPAPAQALPPEVYRDLFLITPNETEAAFLTGIPVTGPETAAQAAARLLSWGAQQALITLGAGGAWFQNSQGGYLTEPPPVQAVDTTAAGDVFNGALAVALAEGQDWPGALQFAHRAAALSVTRMGAQASAPFRRELQ